MVIAAIASFPILFRAGILPNSRKDPKMKSTLRCIPLFLLILLSCIACSDATVARVEIPGISQSASNLRDTLKMKDFTFAQRQQWDSATAVWYETQYFGGCLKTLGFELNCTDCTNIGLNLELTVDSTGQILETQVLSSKIYCSKHSEADELKMKDCLLQSFPTVLLPKPFYDKILLVFIGRVPMC